MKPAYFFFRKIVFCSAIGLLFVFFSQEPGLRLSAAAYAPGLDPTVTGIQPSSAGNDLDMPVTISGTGFVKGTGGALPQVRLGGRQLERVTWVSSTQLKAQVPWGLNPGMYTLTVSNPFGGSGSLTNAYTVTPGIGVLITSGPVGGSIDQIVLHPLSPNLLFAAGNPAGLFRSRDGGAHWEFVLPDKGGFTTVALVPSDPNTVYTTSGYGNGVFRSDDGGNTWLRFDVPDSGWTRVAVHPTQAGIAFAYEFTGGPLWKSVDRGQTWVAWTQGLIDTQVAALAFHPENPQHMVLGTQGGYIYTSTDGGAHWQYTSRPLSSIGVIAVNPFGAHEFWIATQAGNVDQAILKSANPGLTQWTPVESEPGKSLSAWAIDFSPIVSGTVFLSSDILYRSTNGGNTWTGEWLDDNLNDIAFHPANPLIVYRAGIKTAVQKSADGAQTWSLSNTGITAIVPEKLK